MRFSRRAKRRLVVVGVLAIVGAGGITGWRVVRRVQLQRLTTEARAEGMAAYERGDYPEALSRLSYYVARDRTDLEAMLAFADARSQVPQVNQRHLIEAITLYRAALRIDPDSREALDALLQLNLRTGRGIEAMEAADQLLALDERHVEALQAKVIGHLQEGQPDEASPYVQRLIEIEPENLTWRALALQTRWRQQAPHDEMVALCDQWIADYDGDGRFHLLKAGVLLTGGLVDEAKAEARRAAQLGAASLDVLRSMIDLLDQLGMRAEADQLIELARESFPEKRQVTEVVVRRLWQAGRINEARAELDRHDADELDLELARWNALLLMAGNDRDGADQALDRLAERGEAAPPKERVATLAWIDAVRASQDLADSTWQRTVEKCQKAIALAPQEPVLHYLLGRAFAHVGEHELAAESFERAVRLDGHWLVPRLELARTLLRAGRAQDALDAAAALLQRWPAAGGEAYRVLAGAWLAVGRPARDLGLTDSATGRPVELVSLLERIHDTAPAPLIAAALVDAYVAHGRSAAAETLLRDVLAAPQAEAPMLLALAEASARNGLGLEAPLMERALRIAGPRPEVIEVKAEFLRRQGKVEEGLALIDEALASGTAQHTAVVRRLRAAYLARAGHPQAMPALAALLEAEPVSVDDAALVLAQPVAWEDQSLVALAIERLQGIVGEHTPRVTMARANYVLEFESDDPARLAEVTAGVGEVLNQTPDSVPARVLMSRLLLAGNTPELAIRHLRRAIEIQPGNLELYPHLIALLQRQADYAAAEDYLERFSSRAELPGQLQRAEVGLRAAQGDFETAVLRLASMVDEASPESEQAELAALFLRAGDTEAAGRIYSRLLAAPDRSVLLIEAAARYHASAGRWDDAVALADAPELRGAPASRALMLGRLHQEHGRLEDATPWLKQAVAEAPDDPETWLELVRHWLRRQDVEEANRVARAGIEKHPDSGVLRTALAMTALDLGQSLPAGALDSLSADDEAVRATVSLYEQATDDTGRLVPTQRDLGDARDLIRRFAAFRPAWRLAVQMHDAAGRYEEAVRIARQAVGRFPADPAPAEWTVRLMVQRGHLEDALDVAYTWKDRSLADPLPADTLIASLLVDLGRPAAAIRQLEPYVERLVAAPDRLSDNLSVWVRALLHDGRLQEAAGIVRPLMSQDPFWQTRWLALAEGADVDITAQAIELAEPLLGARPEGELEVAEHWLRLARRSGEDAHYRRADELASAAGEQPHLAVAALHIRASVAGDRGDLAAVEATYRAILARNPQDVAALNNLAFALIDVPERCAEAVDLSRRALDLAPENPHVLDTYAHALVCDGDVVEAESAARRAAAARPGDPGPLLTLVEILISAARLNEAESELQRAEAALRGRGGPENPNWSQATVLRERLREGRSSSMR